MEQDLPDPASAPVQRVELEELPADADAEAKGPAVHGGLDLVQDVQVRLTMSVGCAQLSIGELYAMKEGALLKLDKATSEPIDVFLDAKLVARGELMVAEDHFAIRITELGGKP